MVPSQGFSSLAISQAFGKDTPFQPEFLCLQTPFRINRPQIRPRQAYTHLLRFKFVEQTGIFNELLQLNFGISVVRRSPASPNM